MAGKEALLALQLSCRGDAAREATLRDWLQFAESRQEAALLQSLPKTPAGGAIDWLKLYEEVVARGGFSIVSQRQQWPEILGPNGLNIKGLMPYQLAAHYDRYLRAFEEKQLFGRDVPPSEPSMSVLPSKRPAQEGHGAPIATAQDLQDAQGGMGGTPLPKANKRFKAQRELQTHLGSLHHVVLALDSDLPEQVLSALNLLTVLSYGDGVGEQQTPHHHHQNAATAKANDTANENELLVDNVPGLLDALYRQLVACKLLPDEKQLQQQQARRRLLNLTADDGERELLDTRALLVLNIVRNLAIVGANEKPVAAHDELCVFLILALRYVNSSDVRNCRGGRTRAAVEIGDHVLDTLCAVSKRIDFLALHPPAALQVWHPQYQLSSQLWEKERVLPLECLLRELRRILVGRELKQEVPRCKQRSSRPRAAEPRGGAAGLLTSGVPPARLEAQEAAASARVPGRGRLRHGRGRLGRLGRDGRRRQQQVAGALGERRAALGRRHGRRVREPRGRSPHDVLASRGRGARRALGAARRRGAPTGPRDARRRARGALPPLRLRRRHQAALGAAPHVHAAVGRLAALVRRQGTQPLSPDTDDVAVAKLTSASCLVLSPSSRKPRASRWPRCATSR